MSEDDLKRKAAHAALDLLPERGLLGLGTGSTTRWFIEAVGDLVRAGRQFVAVPTSQASRRLAQELGIPLLDDAGPWQIELCVDGADEVSATLDLIKGGGGAHAREKIVNHAARRNVIIVDDTKLSTLLGEKRKVPVEVLPFGAKTTAAALAELGRPQLRETDGTPFQTELGQPHLRPRCGAPRRPARAGQAAARLAGRGRDGPVPGPRRRRDRGGQGRRAHPHALKGKAAGSTALMVPRRAVRRPPGALGAHARRRADRDPQQRSVARAPRRRARHAQGREGGGGTLGRPSDELVGR